MNKDLGNASTLLRAASPSPDQMKIVCRRVKCCWVDEATRRWVSYVCDAVVKMSVGVNTSRHGVSSSIKEKKRKLSSRSDVNVSERGVNAAGPFLACHAVVEMSVGLYSSRRGVSFVGPPEKEGEEVKNRLWLYREDVPMRLALCFVCLAVVKMSVESYASRREVSFFRPMMKGEKGKEKSWM